MDQKYPDGVDKRQGQSRVNRVAGLLATRSASMAIEYCREVAEMDAHPWKSWQPDKTTDAW